LIEFKNKADEVEQFNDDRAEIDADNELNCPPVPVDGANDQLCAQLKNCIIERHYQKIRRA
jgi:hypothetical protein